MLLSRFSILIAAFLCQPTWLPGHQAVPTPTGSTSVEAAANIIQPAAAVSTFSRASALTPYSPWRYRLKSVLREGSDPRIARESDLGPVPVPDHFFTLVAHTSESGQSPPLVPLRC
jgi:hypothetical protein